MTYRIIRKENVTKTGIVVFNEIANKMLNRTSKTNNV